MDVVFLFVGERPSRQAVKIGATWQNGRLAGKQLHDALRALHIDPGAHDYMNIWRWPERSVLDGPDEAESIVRIRQQHEHGRTVVGMGALVCAVLRREGIPHLQLIHPAARGAIRKKERYTAHVRAVLEGS